MGIKTCYRCKKVKSLSEFHKQTTASDGLYSWCKECRREYDKQPERVACRKANEKTPQCIAYRRAQSKRPDKIEWLREYNRSERGLAYHRAWEKTLKGKAKIARKNSKRRDWTENTVCDLTAQEWEEIKVRQNYKCAICGEVKPLHRDHVFPLSLGGNLTKANVQGLCISCNGRKGNKII